MSAHASGGVGPQNPSFASPGNSYLISLRRVQLTRSNIVAQLHRANLADAIRGLYVRVLLELENGGEEYKIARILNVEQGTEYSGFTYDATVTTDQYLVLELSPPAKSDNHYQLNSVSNKEFQHNEFQVWQRDVALGRLIAPTETEINTTLLEKLRALATPHSTGGGPLPHQSTSNSNIPALAQQPQGNPGPPPPSVVVSSVSTWLENQIPAQRAAGGVMVGIRSGSNTGVTSSSSATRNMGHAAVADSVVLNSGGGIHHVAPHSVVPVMSTSSSAGPVPVPVDEDSSESDYEQTDEELRRTVEEELRERYFVVPKELLEQSTQELRRLDRDVGEYIEKIRENLENNATKCIACMVHDPAVIILPCKHKVLCRGCCTKVLICPMCRKKIREVFEPVEM